MRDELLARYEEELRYLRRFGEEFASRYPKVASRLQLEPSRCDDPHVERLLEGFALLTARVHLKLEDDFPEVAEALLGVMAPQYLRPVPSLSIVEFEPDTDQGRLTTGLPVPRGSLLYSRAVDGTRCTFRTCYDATLWPITVHDAGWVAPQALRPSVRAGDAVGALRIELRCAPGLTFASLKNLSSLRLFLDGGEGLAATLYELLFNSCAGVLVREAGGDPGARTVTLPPSAVRPVGFADDERLLPYPAHALNAAGLLHEYFAFPHKYLFVDLAAMGDEAVRAARFGNAIEVIFLIQPFHRPERGEALATGVTRSTIRLGCAPAVNLFPRTSEHVALTQRKTAYPVVADRMRRHTTEIYSIDSVVVVTPGSPATELVAPLYALRYSADGTQPRLFWHARRGPALPPADGEAQPGDATRRESEAGDVLLSFVDADGRLTYPERDTATARLTCHNGMLPSRLPTGPDGSDFELHGGGPIKRVTAVVRPTRVLPPPTSGSLFGRLVSQLSLNHLSLTDGDGAALRELLRLQLFGDALGAAQQIEGLVRVRGAPAYARLTSEYGIGLARGRRIEIDFDEDKFAGGNVFLFASVLERFLALYAGLNSFTALTAHTRQRRTPLRVWEPRAGCRILS
jgi:type VI secretion system protein ImpG